MPRRQRGTPPTYQSTPITQQSILDYIERNAESYAQDAIRVAQGRRSRLPFTSAVIHVPIEEQNPINNAIVLQDEDEDPK
jgi:hypothetical protein